MKPTKIINKTIYATCPKCGNHEAYRRFEQGGGGDDKESWSHVICSNCNESIIVEE